LSSQSSNESSAKCFMFQSFSVSNVKPQFVVLLTATKRTHRRYKRRNINVAL
jgi:hypothetical protein